MNNQTELLINALVREYSQRGDEVVTDICYDRALCKMLNVDYCDTQVFTAVRNALENSKQAKSTELEGMC